MPTEDVTWNYATTEVSEDKRSLRTNCPPEAAAELIGFDGALEGSLGPAPGLLYYDNLESAPGTRETEFPNDFFPIHFRVSDKRYAHGYVYRLIDGAGGGSIKIRYNLDQSGGPLTWTTFTVATYAPASYDPRLTVQMDVAVFGRFVYIFIEGYEPQMFYITAGLVATLLTDTGPGAAQSFTQGSFSTEPADPNFIENTIANSALLHFKYYPFGDGTQPLFLFGTYQFAYFLYDSRTGRRSALATYTSPTPAPGISPSEAAGYVELLYDATKWDTIYLYRSLRGEDSGGLYGIGTLFLDQQTTLSAYADQSGVPGGQTRARLQYTIQDTVIIGRDTYTDFITFDVDMPTGGAAGVYETTMFVGKIAQTGSTGFDGVGELRWSSLQTLYPGPELFSPLSRYVPKVPSDEVIRFIACAGCLLGFSTTKVYMIRRESLYVKVYEMHEGYGLVGPRAACAVGSSVYYLTHKGLKVVDTTGQLSDVRSINSIVVDRWAGDNLQYCTLAYDAPAGVLFVHNPVEAETACLWFNTSQVTELRDVTFEHIEQGFAWSTPDQGTVDGGKLEQRALFVNSYNRIYYWDHLRRKTVTNSIRSSNNGRTRYSFLDFTGDSLHRVGTAVSALQTVTIDTAYSNSCSRIEGGKLYWLTGDNAGESATISATSGSTFILDETFDQEVGDLFCVSPVYTRWMGSQLGVQVQTPYGTQPTAKDMLRVRHVNSLGVSYGEVRGIHGPASGTITAISLADPAIITSADHGLKTGDRITVGDSNCSPPVNGEDLVVTVVTVNTFSVGKATTATGTTGTWSMAARTVAKFRAGIYRDNEDDPRATTTPTAVDGSAIASITQGVSRNWAAFGGTDSDYPGRYGLDGSAMFPSVETWITDVDFEMLGVYAEGTIRPTERTKNPI